MSGKCPITDLLRLTINFCTIEEVFTKTKPDELQINQELQPSPTRLNHLTKKTVFSAKNLPKKIKIARIFPGEGFNMV